MTTLLLSARATEDNQALWRAAVRAGWTIERIRGITVPDGPSSEDVVLYVEALFAPEIAKKLSLKLVEPQEDWLVELPFQYRKREVRITTLGEARKLKEPAFVKPPNDKLFTAKVFASGKDLPADYDDSMAVLIAEPVESSTLARSPAMVGRSWKQTAPGVRAFMDAMRTKCCK